MCDALRDLMKEEIEEEIKEEGNKARESAILTSIQNLMDSMKWTAEQAMDALKLPMDDRAKYAARL